MDFLTFLSQLLDTSGFPPRWLCGTGWLNFTGWFMIASDLMIFGAYVSIPMLLLYFVNKRKDMVFPRIFWLFAAFIFACGISHLLDALMFWWPVYRLNAMERFLTGLISWTTVFALVPIIPMALSLKTPAQLEKEIVERKAAEEKLRELNENLERIVQERTRELNEKALQLQSVNQELESFSYSVSHDLKAPLRKIQQFNDMIQQSESMSPEELRDYLGRMSGSANQMSSLIDDLLSFSRVAGFELKREKVDISEMAREIIRDFSEQEPERRVETAVQDGMTCYGDSVLVRSVLQNLLGNAWKYTVKSDPGRIETGFMLLDGEKVFFVRDNGIGFDMSQVNRLFRPFQRLVNKNEYPGTGIGLATVQRIVTRHGGKVWAEGKPDAGRPSFSFCRSAEFAFPNRILV